MSQEKNIEISFRVDESMVARFAQLTGDFNSMHMNQEVARKSKYRRTVVHGMIPFSFLQFLQTEFPEQDIVFLDFKAKFIRPVFSGDVITLLISYHLSDGTGEFDAIWTANRSAEKVTKSSGAFKLADPSGEHLGKTDSAEDSFLSEKITENQFLISDLNDQKESIGFSINGAAKHHYINDILNHGIVSKLLLNRLCGNISALFMLSTMVGMRLPG